VNFLVNNMFHDRDTGFAGDMDDDITRICDTDIETIEKSPLLLDSLSGRADVSPPVTSRSEFMLAPYLADRDDPRCITVAPASVAHADTPRPAHTTVAATQEQAAARHSGATARRQSQLSRVPQRPSGLSLSHDPCLSTRTSGQREYPLSSESDAARNRLTQRSFEREIRQLQSKVNSLLTSHRPSACVNTDDCVSSDGSVASDHFHSADANPPRTASVRGSEADHRPSRRSRGNRSRVGECPRSADGNAAVRNCPATSGRERTSAPGDNTVQASVVVSNASTVDAVANDNVSNVTASSTVMPRKPLKLEKFDGVSVPLETFLVKLENVARYNNWQESDKVVFLCDALTGNASQILWELKPDATSQDIINLMRVRFGNTHNTERFRAELYSRKRGAGETTPSVYQDIRRLLALAFPGQAGELYESIGREAFLSTLNDPALRIRVLDKGPKTLDETMAVVTQMEAYSNASNAGQGHTGQARQTDDVPEKDTSGWFHLVAKLNRISA